MERFDETRLSALKAQETVAAGNGEVLDQNQRLEKTNRIASEAIRVITRNGIHDEQVDSFLKVLLYARNIPYEDMAHEISRLENEESDVESLQSETAISLERDRELALRLTSKRQTEIMEAYNNEVESSKRERLQEIRDELSDRYDEFETLGQAWPIPQLISPEQRNHLSAAVSNSDEAGTIVDIIPVTPTKIQRINVLAEKAERQIENPDLSKNILFYLREETGNTVTVEDLVRFCCKLKDSEDEGDYRSNVTTALGPEIEGPKKQRELEKEGLKLQYGYRYLYMPNKDGRLVVKRRTRIYRVVEMDVVAESSVISTSAQGQVQDEWENVERDTNEGTEMSAGIQQPRTEGEYTPDQEYDPTIVSSSNESLEMTDMELLGADVLMLEKATKRAIARTLKKRCLAGEGNEARLKSNDKAIKRSVVHAVDALDSAVNL